MTMHSTLCTLAAGLIVASIASPMAVAAPVNAGLTEITVADPKGGRGTTGFMWYPTTDDTGAQIALGNPVWQGVSVIPDAAPQAGSHPLLVMSHGMYGNARNQAWLATALARAGYMVAAIDHPGTSSFSRDTAQARALWERPRDITRLIDHIIADPKMGALVDRDRIFMAGHSLGGFTAVALAGGRFDPARFAAHCATSADLACDVLKTWGVAGTEADRAAFKESAADPRIRAFAVFDLGGTQSFSPASLSAIDRPMLIFGAPAFGSWLDLDIESRALAAHLPKATSRYLEPDGLQHFDFLGICTDKALMILEEEDPDDVIVCKDGIEERAGEHRFIINEVQSFFARN